MNKSLMPQKEAKKILALKRYTIKIKQLWKALYELFNFNNRASWVNSLREK